MKTWLIAAAAALTFTLAASAVSAEEPAVTKEGAKLTTEQQRQMAVLYEELFAKRKEIVAKYVEFGVIPEEKGKKIEAHLNKRMEKLKEHGYLPPHHSKKKDAHPTWEESM